MSKEYIERERYYKYSMLYDLAYHDNVNGNCDGKIDITVVDSISGADVKPVQHGKWIDTDTFDFHCVHIYQCSNCGKEVADDYIDNHKFCLHCGADMSGGSK